MMQAQCRVLLVVTVAVLIMAGGCNYYKVTDLNSGYQYFTKDVNRTGSGAAKFEDEVTGREVTIQNSEVKEITKDDYQAALRGIDTTVP